jgi:PAS domain-containing protein
MEQLARALELPLGELLIRSGWAGGDPIGTEAEEAVDRGAFGPPEDDSQEIQERVDELHGMSTGLQAGVTRLQSANDRLRDRGIERAAELRTAEAIVEQLRAILNALSDPVVVVDTSGFVVVENTAYGVFAARHTDTPAMLDPAGVPIPKDRLPLERAARGEQFAMEIDIEADGERRTYRVEGQPASTVVGGLVGVVTIRQEGD